MSKTAAIAELDNLPDDAVLGVTEAAALLGAGDDAPFPESLARRLAIREDWTRGPVADYRLRGHKEGREWRFTGAEVKRAKRELARARRRLQKLPDDREVGIEDATLFLRKISAFRIRQMTAIVDKEAGTATFRATIRDPLKVVPVDQVPERRIKARKVSDLAQSAPLAYEMGELRRFEKVDRPAHRPLNPDSPRRGKAA